MTFMQALWRQWIDCETNQCFASTPQISSQMIFFMRADHSRLEKDDIMWHRLLHFGDFWNSFRGCRSYVMTVFVTTSSNSTYSVFYDLVPRSWQSSAPGASSRHPLWRQTLPLHFKGKHNFTLSLMTSWIGDSPCQDDEWWLKYVCQVSPFFHSVITGGNQGVASGEAGESGERWLQPGPQGGGQHQVWVWPVYGWVRLHTCLNRGCIDSSHQCGFWFYKNAEYEDYQESLDSSNFPELNELFFQTDFVKHPCDTGREK